MLGPRSGQGRSKGRSATARSGVSMVPFIVQAGAACRRRRSVEGAVAGHQLKRLAAFERSRREEVVAQSRDDFEHR